MLFHSKIFNKNWFTASFVFQLDLYLPRRTRQRVFYENIPVKDVIFIVADLGFAFIFCSCSVCVLICHDSARCSVRELCCLLDSMVSSLLLGISEPYFRLNDDQSSERDRDPIEHPLPVGNPPYSTV